MFNREEKEFESEGLLEQAAARPSDSQRSYTLLRSGLFISIFLNIAFASFTIWHCRGSHSSYDRGFATDLGAYLSTQSFCSYSDANVNHQGLPGVQLS